MGNKKLRNTLLALVLTPFFALSATGCWKINNDITEEQKSVAYSIIRNHFINENYLPESKSNTVKTAYNDSYNITTDWSNSAIPEDKRDYILNEFGISNESEEYIYEVEYGYNYENNSGYFFEKSHINDKDENNNSLDTESFRIDVLDFTKKTGNNFYNYRYKYNYNYSDSKIAYRVDDKYAVNQYKNDAIEDIEYDSYTVLKNFKANETLNDLKQNLNNFGIDCIKSYDSSDLPENLESLNINSQLDITSSKDLYTLNFSTTIHDVIFEEETVGDINAQIIIKFSESSIEFFEYKITKNLVYNINCEEEVSSLLPEINFSSSNYISTNGLLESSLSYDLTNSFNNEVIPEDVSDYIGTGENGVIIENYTSISAIYVDFDNLRSSGITLQFNKPVNFNNLYSFVNGHEHISSTLYWDEECTRPVQDNDLAPSYDTNVYVKLTVEDGYIAVLESSVYSDNYRNVQLFKVCPVSENNYTIITPSSYGITHVELNGTKIENYNNGITLSGSKFYLINVYVNYSK